MILSTREDALEAARLAYELNRVLRTALYEQDDGQDVVDYEAWIEAGSFQLLLATSRTIERVIERLDRFQRRPETPATKGTPA